MLCAFAPLREAFLNLFFQCLEEKFPRLGNRRALNTRAGTEVQTALFVFRMFPPPAAVAFVFAFAAGAGAAFASDR